MNEENKKSEDAIENEDMIDSVDSVTPKGLHVVNAVTALVSVSDVAGSKSFVGKLGTLWDMKNNIAKDFVEGRSQGPSATHEIECCHENLHAFNH